MHDHIILSYLADFDNEQLVIETQCPGDDATNGDADILFEGYLTHIFCHEQRDSILLDIEECAFDRFYESAAIRLEEGRQWGWPIDYETPDTKAELARCLRTNRYKIYQISASRGLAGWVIARKMEIIRT